MTEAKYTPFNAMMDIIAAPGTAMDGVRGHNSWLWWPLLVSVGVAIAGAVYYAFWVDFPWLVEETIRALPEDSPPESADQIRDFMSPAFQAGSAAIAVPIITLIIYAIQALYLNLVTKMTGSDEFGFGDWFSFSAWTAFPNMFNSLIMFGVLLTASTNQVGQESLLPLSMNTLFIGAAPGDPWFTWGTSLTLVNIWVLVIMGIGYQRWTKASLGKSMAITWAPWVLLFGGWAAMV